MHRPTPRGPLSAMLLDTLLTEPRVQHDLGSAAEPDTAHFDLTEAARTAVTAASDALADDDIQLTLYVLYELHYRGVEGVSDVWEWDPGLLAARALLEQAFEATLRARVPVPVTDARTADEVAAALFALASSDTGPSLSTFVAKRATVDQLLELIVQRSIYHLKEADPHSWALPRLTGRAKSALIEVQADEYGGGRPGFIHSELFARTMRALGLDDSYGRYVDLVPALTLASVNMMSLFGLHRRLRGAIAGHLAAFEMTSSIPCRRYGNGFRRHGYGPEVTWYFDEHVEADAVHEQIAGRDLAGGLVEAEPALLPDVLFGAAAYLVVDGLAGAELLTAWERGRSALRGALPLAA